MNICEVLAKFAEERAEFDRMLLRTMRYLRAQHVNRELQTKVRFPPLNPLFCNDFQ